jgi:hypothetical protein
VLGLRDWSHAVIYCVLCVGFPHCQHSAVSLLFSCTVTLAPSVYKTGYSSDFVLLRQKWDSSREGERIETYRNGVRCEVFSVENCNGKNMKKYLG